MTKSSGYLYFICLIATMGGLMFGFDIAIISGAVPFIQPYFGWNELELGWGVSSLLVGAIVGSFGSGILTDRYGRKRVLDCSGPVLCSLMRPDSLSRFISSFYFCKIVRRTGSGRCFRIVSDVCG